MSGARRRTTAGFRKKVLLKLPDAMRVPFYHMFTLYSPHATQALFLLKAFVTATVTSPQLSTPH